MQNWPVDDGSFDWLIYAWTSIRCLISGWAGLLIHPYWKGDHHKGLCSTIILFWKVCQQLRRYSEREIELGLLRNRNTLRRYLQTEIEDIKNWFSWEVSMNWPMSVQSVPAFLRKPISFFSFICPMWILPQSALSLVNSLKLFTLKNMWKINIWPQSVPLEQTKIRHSVADSSPPGCSAPQAIL